MALRGKAPERYGQLIEFYSAGQANALDILKADFGHWPPNGPDIVHTPNFPVYFRSAWRTPKAYGYASPGGYKNIALTLLLMRANLVAGSTYLAFSIFLNALRLRGYVNPHDKSGTIHFNDLYRMLEGSQGGRRMISHILTHEFKHVMQVRDKHESLSSAFDNTRLSLHTLLKPDTRQHTRYLALECELQARLHTVIVGAYHQFERLPVTRGELYACLASQGIHVPQHLFSETDQAGFTRDEAFYMRYADKVAVRNINEVIDHIVPDQRDKFWQDVIPFIYGDMLELWGDRLGLKRMGHTHNVQLREIFYRTAHDIHMMTAEPIKTRKTRQSRTRIDEIVAKKQALQEKVIRVMPKDDALDLACLMAAGIQYREFGSLNFPARLTEELSQQVTNIFAIRDDLEDKDHARIIHAKKDFSRAHHHIRARNYESAQERLELMRL